MKVITLPFPPSVNHYWRHIMVGKFPRSLISKRGRQYRKDVAYVCLVENAPRNLAGPLQCVIELYPPCNRRRDCDNYAKALLDALDHADVYGDDSQIVDLRIRMHAKEPPGMAVVKLGPAEVELTPKEDDPVEKPSGKERNQKYRVRKMLEGGAVSLEELCRRLRMPKKQITSLLNIMAHEGLCKRIQIGDMPGFALRDYNQVTRRPFLTPAGAKLVRELEGAAVVPRWGVYCGEVG